MNSLQRIDVGPLHERSFRYLFLGRTTSFIGNAFASVALAFAVLELTGSKSDLGLVLAARSLPQVLFLLVGGIWADRLPRHRVMVFSNVVSGLSQGAIAALLLTGQAEVWHLLALAAVNGLSTAFFFPAATGIVPQTVPHAMLQPANAILRLGQNASWIGGAAFGGLVVAATSPGVGLAVDAASFLVAAVLLAMIRLPATLRMEASSFFAELAEGWREFSSRTWLWVIVLQFGFVNAMILGVEGVLGPAVANEDLGGAAAWGLILTSQSVGLILGGLLLLRVRPRKLLLAGTLGFLLTIPFPLGLAGPLPVAALILLAAVAGIGIEIFGIMWDTTMQQEIPQEKLSRVYSYDALGSFVLIPLGVAIVGPVSELIGTRATIIGATAISLTATLAVLLVRDVRTIERKGSAPLVERVEVPVLDMRG
ncbi:MAG TPA: MFS transporter [Gaiellaceae bacterium]|nr:MFS transporter [Gaiellaceae bacterium]